MPYTAARAIAATFCWTIRYALTPLFGVDFPNECVHPGDRNLFGRMIISPQVIQMATSETSVYRRMESGGQYASRMERGGHAPSWELEFDAQLYRPRSRPDTNLDTQPGRTPFLHHGYTRDYGGEGGGGGGYRSSPDYGTDISTTSTTAASTVTHSLSAASPRNAFTPVNTPRSLDGLQRGIPSPETLSTSMRRMSVQQRTVPAAARSDSDGESESEVDLSPKHYRPICSFLSSSSTSPSSSLSSLSSSSPACSPTTSSSTSSMAKTATTATTTTAKTTTKTTKTPPIEIPRKRKPSAALFAREVKAAHALLDLHTTATASDDEFVGSLACRVGGVGGGVGGGIGIGIGMGGEGARKRRRASA